MDTTSENVSHNSFEDLPSEEYVFKISNITELTDVYHRNDRSMKETFCSGKNFIDRIKSVKSRLERIEHKKKIIEERQVNWNSISILLNWTPNTNHINITTIHKKMMFKFINNFFRIESMIWHILHWIKCVFLTPVSKFSNIFCPTPHQRMDAR